MRGKVQRQIPACQHPQKASCEDDDALGWLCGSYIQPWKAMFRRIRCAERSPGWKCAPCAVSSPGRKKRRR